MAHHYEVGTGAWQPDATEGWIASVVEEKIVDGDRVKLVFRLSNDEVMLGSYAVLTSTAAVKTDS